MSDAEVVPRTEGAPTLPAIHLRRPTEADHRPIVGVVDEWWGGRRVRQLLPRLWLQHFRGTSWVAETEEGRLAGFLVGFVSPDDPEVGYVHLAGVDPNLRRRGLGRRLYQAFIDDVAGRGVHRVTAVTWPGNRGSVAFHTRIGFRVDDGPGTQRLYGTPAYPSYDGGDEDRAVLTREIEPPSPDQARPDR
jgi:GNAT superfamily N-acetyltransferase